MCDERERLIGFLYDEVDPTERRRVEAHLDECPECRAQIAGLQSTRQDLLAWAVPAHEPIWRPMAPERPAPPLWQQVPAWAMAAAASAVLASGLMGGLAVRWLTPVPQTAAAVAPEPGTVAGPVSASPDLAAVEDRVLARVREELRRELVALTSRPTAPETPANVAVSGRDVALAALTRRVTDIERWRRDQDDWVRQQVNLNYAFENGLGRVNSRTRAIDNELARANMMRVSASGAGDFPR